MMENNRCPFMRGMVAILLIAVVIITATGCSYNEEQIPQISPEEKFEEMYVEAVNNDSIHIGQLGDVLKSIFRQKKKDCLNLFVKCEEEQVKTVYILTESSVEEYAVTLGSWGIEETTVNHVTVTDDWLDQRGVFEWYTQTNQEISKDPTLDPSEGADLQYYAPQEGTSRPILWSMFASFAKTEIDFEKKLIMFS